MQRGASRRISIHFKSEEFVDLALDIRPAAGEKLIAVHPGLDERENGAGIFFVSAADSLILVGMDQGADSLVGKDLRQQPLLYPPVNNVHPRHAPLGGPNGMF